MAKYIPAQTPMEHILRTFVYLVFELLKTEAACREGIVVIGVGTGVGWQHMKVNVILELLQVVQYTMPLRFIHIFCVNLPMPARVALTLVWPFLSSKLRSRIVSLQESRLPHALTPMQIPSDIGGKYDMDVDAWCASAGLSELRLRDDDDDNDHDRDHDSTANMSTSSFSVTAMDAALQSDAPSSLSLLLSPSAASGAAAAAAATETSDSQHATEHIGNVRIELV